VNLPQLNILKTPHNYTYGELAITRKTGCSSATRKRGERSAILYTVIESCRRREIDPYTYLRDVLTRLPNMTNRQIPEVTPEIWAKSRCTTTPSKAS